MRVGLCPLANVPTLVHGLFLRKTRWDVAGTGGPLVVSMSSAGDVIYNRLIDVFLACRDFHFSSFIEGMVLELGST